MSPQFRLIYYDIRGYGELSRFILAHAGQEYEDVRLPYGQLTDEQIDELNLPWDLVPVLQVDGETLSQSMTIARFLAKRFNLSGKSAWEEAKCDEIVDSVRDYALKWRPLFHGLVRPDQIEGMRKDLIETHTPYYLDKLTQILEKNGTGWLVGNEVTWADLYVAHVFPHYEISWDTPELTQGYTAVQKLIEKVSNLRGIKEYLAVRPTTKW